MNHKENPATRGCLFLVAARGPNTYQSGSGSGDYYTANPRSGVHATHPQAASMAATAPIGYGYVDKVEWRLRYGYGGITVQGIRIVHSR